MFKFLFEFILIAIIIFFVWNILKRLFLSFFYGQLAQKNQNPQNAKQDTSKKKEQGLNWDAETVEYEEIKDDEKKSN